MDQWDASPGLSCRPPPLSTTRTRCSLLGPALSMTSGTRSRRLVLHRTLTCPTSGSGEPRALLTAIISDLTGERELHFAPKGMAAALMRSRATSSPSSPANCALSCTALDVSSASKAVRPRNSIPKSDICREQTGARVVPMHMCAWFLQPHTCQPQQFHKKATWWLVSAELFPYHTHVPLGGPRHLPGVPAARVAQQYTVPLCAAWGLAVRAAFEQWDWRQSDC